MQAITSQPNLPKNSEPGSTDVSGAEGRAGNRDGSCHDRAFVANHVFRISVLKQCRGSEGQRQQREHASGKVRSPRRHRSCTRDSPWAYVQRSPQRAGWNCNHRYLTTARSVSFRNPASWATFRSLNLADPTSDVSSVNDDGLITTGRFPGNSAGTQNRHSFHGNKPIRIGDDNHSAILSQGDRQQR